MALWLRKSGTNQVFIRTRILAERPDMFAIEEEEAMAIRGRTESGRKLEIANQQLAVVDKPDAGAPDPLDVMGEDALRSEAAKLKIALRDNMKLDTIRRKVREVRDADAKDAAETSGDRGKKKPAVIVDAPAAPVAPATPVGDGPKE